MKKFSDLAPYCPLVLCTAVIYSVVIKGELSTSLTCFIGLAAALLLGMQITSMEVITLRLELLDKKVDRLQLYFEQAREALKKVNNELKQDSDEGEEWKNNY